MSCSATLMMYVLCIDLIEPVRSGQLFAEALACTERSGDQLIGSFLHNNAGVHALRAGDLPPPGLIWNRQTKPCERSERCAPPSARSGSTAPTPRAKRSASTRPSTSPAERTAPPDTDRLGRDMMSRLTLVSQL